MLTEDDMSASRDELPGASRAPVVVATDADQAVVTAHLRRIEARYHALASAGVHILWSTNADGDAEEDVPSWCAYTGQSPDEMLGSGWLDAIHPDDREATQQAWLRAVATKGPYTGEHRIRAANGDYRTFLVHGVPVLGDDGVILEFVGYCTDISEYKRAVGEHTAAIERQRAKLRRLDILQGMTEAALTHLNTADLLDDLLVRIRALMQADSVAVLLRSDDGRFLIPRATHGPDEGIAADLHVPFGEGFAGRIAASRRPLVVNDLRTYAAPTSYLCERLTSAVGVPLTVEGRLIGVLQVGSIAAREFTDEDAELLRLVGDRIAIAIDHASLYEAAQLAREQAEAASARLRATLGVLPVGVYIADASGALVERNAAATAIWGESAPIAPMVDGVPTYGAYKAWRSDTGEQVAAEEWALARVFATGEAAPTDELTIETFDGARKTILANAAPVRDETGAVVGGVASIVDISERKRLERASAERAAELETMFDSIADAVLVYDPEGHIVRMNTAARTLISLDRDPSFIKRSPNERATLSHTRDADGRPLTTAEFTVNRMLRGEVLAGPTTVDILIRSLDGREIRVNCSGAPIHDKSGRLLGAVQIMRDVTEQRRLETERGQILSVVSHELKTPLTSLKARVQMARRRLAKAQSPEVEYLGRVEHDIARVERLVNDLLDASRVEAGKLELEIARHELTDLCEQVVDEQIAATGREIARDLPSEPLVILADAGRVEQVLTNLLSNALKYSPEDASVRVIVRRSGAFAEVAVRDRGPGISHDAQPRLFERFYRAPGIAVQSGSGIGLGLGLYICRALVEGQGGRLTVVSAPGAGSTFTFTLPLAD